MKKLVCWLMTLALLLACAGGLAETADGNEKTSFLQITGSAPVPVYREITDAEKADELQPGQLCGLLDDVTAETGIRWYRIIYVNPAKKSAVGYIRPEYAHRLTLAEFNALAEDPAKANEAMDLLDAVNAYLKSGSGTRAAAGAGNTEAGGEESAQDESFQAFYESAMDSLDQVFNMDVPSAGPDIEGQVRDIASQAADAGQNFLDSPQAEEAPVNTDDLQSLLADMQARISGLKDVSEETLGSWVDEINRLFEGDQGPEYPGDETLIEKLDRLKFNLSGTTDDLSSALRAALGKIEDKGLLDFASQLLQSLSQANPGQWAEILNSGSWQGGN